MNVGSLRSALTLQFTSAMVRGGDAGVLARENPVQWVSRRPDNYPGRERRYDPRPALAGRRDRTLGREFLTAQYARKLGKERLR